MGGDGQGTEWGAMPQGCTCTQATLARAARFVPPAHTYPMRLVLSTAVPLVAVSMALRRPSSARVGIWYLSRVVPSDPACRGGQAAASGPTGQQRFPSGRTWSAQGKRLAGPTLHLATQPRLKLPCDRHPPAVMSTICALRWPMRSTTWPTCSSGTWGRVAGLEESTG